mmetsp:Transcript_18160/g.27019  ORF Transcript_18160/g.27019 Transcript_18160/m.27019 type:complete len:122 (-) Transcript_18160:28-393(-)
MASTSSNTSLIDSNESEKFVCYWKRFPGKSRKKVVIKVGDNSTSAYIKKKDKYKVYDRFWFSDAKAVKQLLAAKSVKDKFAVEVEILGGVYFRVSFDSEQQLSQCTQIFLQRFQSKQQTNK